MSVWFKLIQTAWLRSGNDGEEATPVPIPNTEVKLFSADGSWDSRPCESRTLPGKQKPVQYWTVFFVLPSRKRWEWKE